MKQVKVWNQAKHQWAVHASLPAKMECPVPNAKREGWDDPADWETNLGGKVMSKELFVSQL